MQRSSFTALAFSLGLFAATSVWAATAPMPVTPLAKTPDILTMAEAYVKPLGYTSTPVCSSTPVQGTPYYSCTVVGVVPFVFPCDPEKECFGALPFLGTPNAPPVVPPNK